MVNGCKVLLAVFTNIPLDEEEVKRELLAMYEEDGFRSIAGTLIFVLVCLIPCVRAPELGAILGACTKTDFIHLLLSRQL